MKFGGSLTLRSREILNADTIVGNFSFNNNMTSNCAGQPAGCTVNSATGFDVASFMLGLVSAKNRNLFDAGTYTEKRPEIAMYAQDDFRVSSKLTVNMGLRYDIYPPWREIEDRQSNFDVTTGKFVVASDDAVIEGVKVGRYLQTYSKSEPGSALRVCLRPRRQRQEPRPRRLRRVLELLARRHLVLQGAEPAVPAVHVAEPDADRLRQQPAALDRPAARLRASIRTVPPAGATRSIFDINFRDAYARQWNVNYQRSLGSNYMAEVAYVGSQGRQMVIKVDINQAPPVVGVSDANVNRPFIGLAPAVRSLSQSQSIGKVNYNGLLVKFQRRFANNFSFLNSYTFGKSMDYASDNEAGITNTYDLQYNWGPSDYDVRHTLLVELDLRAAVGPRRSSTAAGSWAASSTGAAACR